MIDPRDPDFTDTPVSKHRRTDRFAVADPHAPPVVSVVTPFYQPGRLFHETARSLFGQTLQQWEWLIVNDASTDRASLEALAEVRGRDPRVRVIDHAENRGPSAARNTAIRAAHADYLYLLDDDDLIEPTTLEKTLWFLSSHPEYDFANSWSVGFGARGYLWAKGFERGAEFLDNNLATIHAMLRRRAFEAAGGFDESLVDGFEDWEFWLRSADRGLWGGTVREYLDWYRRRPDHGDRWKNLAGPAGLTTFRKRMRERHPRLYAGGFPSRPPAGSARRSPVSGDPPCTNELAAGRPRLLLLLPWLTMGGSDSFNLDVVEHLTRRGWEVTIATTLEGDCSWEPAFARHTPDIFVLHRFLTTSDYPRFLRYLIGSRRPDVVLMSNSELAYLLLPYLRAHCPEPAYIDLCHMEQEEWKGGGYPRYAAGLQECLDLNLVTSRHVSDWMVERGADADRIEVLYTNVDADRWRPDAAARARLRAEWAVPEDEPVVLFAGRLCSQKQPRVLVRTLRALSERGVGFRAVIAGDGEDRDFVEAYLRRHALTDRALLPGPVPRQAIREVMSGADVFFLPSAWEGIALSIYEAMAMGLVVVGADVGGQSELVTRECGILLSRSDEDTEVEGYADVLEKLLRDPERRRGLGRAARERVEAEFRLEQMVDRLLGYFELAREWASSAPRPALPAALAREWAAQAVEHLRVAQTADVLWADRERARREAGAAHPAPSRFLDALGCEAELAAIEASRSWRSVSRWASHRLVRRLFRSTQAQERRVAADDPRLRLAHVKASRRYRLIRALKQMPGYGLYARRRYGASWTAGA